MLGLRQSLLVTLIATIAFSSSLYAQQRSPVPSKEVQAPVLKLVRELFEDEYAKARSNSQRAALAARLLKQGDASKDDIVERYVLFRVAKDIAAKCGDIDTGLAAVDRIIAEFEADEAELRADVVKEAAKKAIRPEERKMVAQHCQAVIRLAMDAERYDLAESLGRLGVQSAARSRDAALLKTMRSGMSQIVGAKRDFEAFRKALAVLKQQPDDASANLTAGKYHCFTKGNWREGLPMLARGGDTALAAPAQRDLQSPSSSGDQASLAELWWSVAESAPEHHQLQLKMRAARWYRTALPQLTGLARAKAEKRLRGIPLAPPNEGPPTITRRAKIAVKAPWPFRLPVTKGQKLHITATGRWRVFPGGKWHGPGSRGFFLQGKLDENKPFRVGNDFRMTVPENGVLHLGMQEGGTYSNNSGEIQVEITIANSASASPPSKIHPVLGYGLKPRPSGSFEFNGHWYQYFPSTSSWSDAQRRCREMGGYLACGETQAEIAMLASQFAKPKETWLGGVKKNGKDWQWISGPPIRLTNWKAGEPNNNFGKEDRLSMSEDGKWLDVQETRKIIGGFICEWEF